MDPEDRSVGDISHDFLYIIFGLVVGTIMSVIVIASLNPYKKGQLDYQVGKIVWTVIDGQIHHIQGPAEK